MGKRLLFEVGVEEIPHEVLTFAIEEFKNKAEEKLKDNGIEYSSFKTYATPRRLSIIIENVAEKTKEKIIERRGPSVKSSFDEDGKPTKALSGFLSACNIKLDEITVKDGYVYMILKEGGKSIKEIFPSVIKEVLFSISFPKTMKWGTCQLSFIRPIRWITCLYGNEHILHSLEGIPFKNISYGHRFLSGGPVVLESADDYEEKLKENFVIVDQEERKRIILKNVNEKARELEAKPLLDDKLLDELVNLTEFPVVSTGKFAEEFLSLPKEVLISEMIEHQKFIPLESKTGKLLNKFLIVLNTQENETIIKGNERVISARLSDGRFFYEEDRKIKLEEYLPRLEGILFARGLGNMLQKVKRIETITEKLCLYFKLEKYVNNAKRTALLCKADLPTNMVYEFPELQGIIGSYYAMESGENERVSKSIREHYLPRFSGDELPSYEEGIIVSLADKFDNLFALYSAGNFVTGSKDPYGLRRQILGIIRILIEKRLHLNILSFVRDVLPIYKEFMQIPESQFIDEIKDFITTRTKTVLKEYGFSYDEIEAGITSEVFDIYDSYLRISAIHEMRATPDFRDLTLAFKRIKNIIKSEKKGKFSEELLTERAEKELYLLYIDKKDVFKDFLDSRNYQDAASILAGFRKTVDRFFDEVLVMEKDERIRTNRITLLSMIDELFLSFIDFSKIVVE